jgi:hypothetical protein
MTDEQKEIMCKIVDLLPNDKAEALMVLAFTYGYVVRATNVTEESALAAVTKAVELTRLQ